LLFVPWRGTGQSFGHGDGSPEAQLRRGRLGLAEPTLGGEISSSCLVEIEPDDGRAALVPWV
jgi:hypothetical protein